jgi:carboxyl-terminal processing protease
MQNRKHQGSFKKLALLAIAVICLLSISAFRKSDVYFEIQRAFSIWSDVFNEISIRYVDEVDPAFLAKTGIDAMLEALDPYTVLIDESESRELDLITRGTYAGIGVEVRKIDGLLTVVHVIEGYPAFKAAIRPGDVISEIDGVSLKGLSPDEANTLMLGDVGSEIALTVIRGDSEIREVSLVRERIVVGNISYASWIDQSAGLGYLHLSRFAPQAAADVKEEMTKFMQEDSLKAIIIDLRNNPGGLLSEAVNIVDLFVPKDVEVVSVKGRMLEMNEAYRTQSDVFFKGPVFILQNEGSASASEIVAGALQDLDRAVILGTSSYGKGLVQIIRPLSYNTSLKMTTAKYLLPSGRSIQSIDYGRSDAGYTAVKDSTRNKFFTSAGRTVQDGKGIDPDISLDELNYGLYVEELLIGDYIFDFSNQYAKQIDSTSVLNMQNVMTDFKAYLDEQDFTFEGPSQAYLVALKESIEKQNVSLSKVTETELATIALKESVFYYQQDFDVIQRLIELELVERVYGEKKRYKRTLEMDKWILAIQSLIKTPNRIDQYLNGQP